MASLKALQEWCRTSCENYRNVEIRNLSTSFRDGLAFCAIIHKYRPDLIDFNSLSKDNVYENNHLAFEVAESKLGIPALLDATDMVSTEVPDRLSIITYLSHYYYYFNKKSHDFQASLKTSSAAESFCHSNPQPDCPGGLKPSKSRTGERSKKGSACSVCASCSKHVHLVQRHLAEGNSTTTAAFRCSVCSSTLLPGSYKEGTDAGSLVCIQHLTASQNVFPDYGKQTESTGNHNVSHVTGKMDSGETVVCGRRQTDTEGDERKTSHNTLKKPRPPDPPQPTAEESPDPGGLTLTPGRDLASGSPVWPVAAPRRVFDSTPPRPAPRTCPPKAAESPSVLGNQVDCKTKPSTFQGGPCKTKTPPWLELVQPGPWPKLPPAPPPRMPKPPRSGSVPSLRGSWYRSKAPPPNPFGELEDKDEVTADDDTSCPEQPMATSQTWCGTSQLAEAAGSHCQANSEAVSRADKSNLDGEDDVVIVPESTDAPKVDSLAKTGCAHLVSILAAETSSTGISESADIDGVAYMPEAVGVLDACHFADTGGSTNKAASSPVLSNLTEAETTTVSHLAYGGPHEATRSLGVSDPAGSGGLRTLVGAISLSTTCNLSEQASSYGVSEDSDSSLNLSSLAREDGTGSVTGEPSVLRKSDIAHSLTLLKSVSVPEISNSLSFPCAKSNSPPTWSTNCAGASSSLQRPPSLPGVPERSVPGQAPIISRSKVCKENPVNQKVSLTEYSKSKPAPGHGFPLIKRKVQTDACVPGEQLQVEMEEVRKRMDRLEQRGVQMENNLRDFQNGLRVCNYHEEEDMWADWFTLIHEKHMLVRRDAELVYMAKQQHLEERQADVEYELRCLLNKPESEWSGVDRSREQQLMEELVTIIEQRNQIVNSLDLDRQREKEEDMLLADMLKKKDFHKEAGKDLKTLRAKFKPIKLLKMLSQKNFKSKDSQKKS
ncbi:MICAL-like protein 1 isoform X2 [Esox lucius]|uniref:MICAL-like protein 1 isoform X2 n=1 Tax=Esox lucius TaxID=8010 RepID=UPI001476F818|nr:MICAL-like protein 1 isoform X2 [Esox lucius]